MNAQPIASEQVSRTEQTRWFTAEVHAHDASLKAYLRGTFPAIRDVEDVVQESYLRMWKVRAAKPIASTKAFLFTVARRLALDVIRRNGRSPLMAVKDLNSLFVLDSGPDGYAAAKTDDEVRLLVQAIESLPARCREIFIRCQMEGRPQKEVALQLGLSENTVAVQSARGLLRCEEFIRRRLKRE